MKKFKSYLENLNLNYSHEMILIGGGLAILAGLFIYVLLFQYTLLNLILIVGAIFICVFGLYYRYQTIGAKIIKEREDEFINLFLYFRIYLQNNYGIYKALEEIKIYASDWFEDKLEQLISDINVDKSIAPFIKFSANFSNPDFETIMISVYQMFDQGVNSEYLLSFSRQFEKVSEYQREYGRTKYDSSLRTLANMALIGTGLFTVGLMFGVVNMMGTISYGF